MSKKILIDAGQEQEIRVALLDDGGQIEDLDFELQSGPKQIKGNIYLARVNRVEPSLQAVFVDYGNEKQGFLSFQEIHPDYFNVPQKTKKQVFEVLYDTAESFGEKEEKQPEKTATKTVNLHKKYTVQQVIKPKQTLLVQVVKEERGNKCAALTTYITLAGRYCILMPNTPGKMGISRKIQGPGSREKLKELLSELEVDDAMSVVIRTAGEGRSKREISKDYEYLLKLWNKISADASKTDVPTLINEESCLIKRTIRDMYSADVGEVVVEGEGAYKIARNFMRSILPGHVKNVRLYKSDTTGLFQHYKIEDQLNTIYNPRVDLPSGGYIIINHTEALIAIDINSGKATKERNIEETAFKINVEAAWEICRQMVIRNLSGIIIVDFIDMENRHNRDKLEETMAKYLKNDRARTQISKISKLGLMEISRQMLKPSIIQSKSSLCPHCGGLGYIQTSDTVGMRVIRALQNEIGQGGIALIEVKTTPAVAMNVLNNHRAMLTKVEDDSGVRIIVTADNEMTDSKFEFYKTIAEEEPEVRTDVPVVEEGEIEILNKENQPRNKRRRGNKPAKALSDQPKETDETDKTVEPKVAPKLLEGDSNNPSKNSPSKNKVKANKPAVLEVLSDSNDFSNNVINFTQNPAVEKVEDTTSDKDAPKAKSGRSRGRRGRGKPKEVAPYTLNEVVVEAASSDLSEKIIDFNKISNSSKGKSKPKNIDKKENDKSTNSQDMAASENVATMPLTKESEVSAPDVAESSVDKSAQNGKTKRRRNKKNLTIGKGENLPVELQNASVPAETLSKPKRKPKRTTPSASQDNTKTEGLPDVAVNSKNEALPDAESNAPRAEEKNKKTRRGWLKL